MLRRYLTIFTIVIFQLAQKANGLDSCGSNSSDSRSLGITVNSKKSDFGKWTDTLHAKAEHSDTLSDISVDVKHNVSQCSGRRIIQIQGLIQNGNYTVDAAVDKQTSKVVVPAIMFHKKHGTNIVVSNNGRTVEKKSLKEIENGSAFTNRPIQDNELFEVRLDQKSDRASYSFGIGILTKDPDEVEIFRQMHLSEYAWVYHNNEIYSNKKTVKSKYGQDLNSLPVNTTFGIMKKPSGDIHFFINQVDQGPAVSGISNPVYGIVELWYNAEKVTIVAP